LPRKGANAFRASSGLTDVTPTPLSNVRQQQAAHVAGHALGPLPALPIHLVALCFHKNRAVWYERRPTCRLDLLRGHPPMMRICEPLDDDCRAGDLTRFGHRERDGVACLSCDHAMAILPSVLNPVFETVTGEAPASFSLSPRPDDTRTC
jgi:hypothetical protein